ncbi:MAG TPA: lysophospholipid acyltransferase family protein [Gemmatimonadaceae bacterium]|nr:lysophospholipid acyltransferase family protein [Gemmatimonadaceae bacterium]
MIYGTLRWIAGVALHWFYGDIRVVGREKIPHDAPLLIAVNHTNALVDSLIIGWLMPRRVVMTAKATLLDNPFIALLFRMLGVVPLRRASDEARTQAGQPLNPARNSGAFRELLQVLGHNGAVLIFPEGTSHSNRELAPLKSGLARVALQARDTAKIKSVHVVPIGLVFEDKAMPGSAVGVRIADPIDIDAWPAAANHAALTDELTRRLKSVFQESVVPPPPERNSLVSRSWVTDTAIALAAWWGRFTHRLPIRIARKIAVRMSTDPDEPAMFTIVIGVGLVLATYAIHLAVVGSMSHSFWTVSLYLIALLTGAHWAAFEPHVKR